MTKHLQQHIINEFSSSVTQELYIQKAKNGLWKSEEILVKKYFKPKSTILDIGCGTGRTTIHLHKLGYKVTGINITPAMIKNAQKIAKSKKLKIKYEIGDATNLRFKASTFNNAIFSFNGWTQIPEEKNRLKTLKEIHRVLKPNGHFIFTSHLRKMRGFTAFWLKQWLKLYLLKPLGFNIKEIDFGDRFFDREGTNKPCNHKQYIHIPNLKKVKTQIAKAGFDLVFIARANTISEEKTGETPPMFYVCKKT